MKTLTPEEANAIVAEMRGVDDRPHGKYVGYTPLELYAPYSRNDQAIEALEAFCKDNGRSVIYFDDSGAEVYLFGDVDRGFGTYDEIILGVGHSKELSAAIVTALCSAELGEPVEIKED